MQYFPPDHLYTLSPRISLFFDLLVGNFPNFSPCWFRASPPGTMFSTFCAQNHARFLFIRIYLIIKTNTEDLRSKFPPEAGKKKRKKKIRATEQAPRAGREELF